MQLSCAIHRLKSTKILVFESQNSLQKSRDAFSDTMIAKILAPCVSNTKFLPKINCTHWWSRRS